jgi:hypothetical protein
MAPRPGRDILAVVAFAAAGVGVWPRLASWRCWSPSRRCPNSVTVCERDQGHVRAAGVLNRPARSSIALALALAASGCTNQAPPPMAPPAAAVSYDGTYTGTLSVTGAAGSVNSRDCATDPRFSVRVTGNQFSFPLPHPVLANTPSLRGSATPVYNASIAPDGTIKGFSNDTNTVMDGRVAGTRMTGQIYGLLCYYAFTADRN